jgi:gamma-D-glutamyl-L-lysine dipeptidyl-peptidase
MNLPMKVKIMLLSFFLLGFGCLIGFNLKNADLSPQSQNRPKPESEESISSPPVSKNAFYIVESKVNIYKKTSKTSEVVTQALYGEPLDIIQEDGQWLKITLKDQFNYQGWAEKKAVENIALEVNNDNKKIVAASQMNLRVNPNEKADVLTILPMGSVITSNKTAGKSDYTLVQLIDGRKGYVYSEELLDYKAKKVSDVSSDQILGTAAKLLNQPYLWGGMTQGGLDCSGFIHTVFKVNGVLLHRDADLQYSHDGVNVNKNIKTIDQDLLPGDLVFFQTYKSGASHVGIYTGNRRFIQSSPSKGVNYGSLDDKYFSVRYLGSKRILRPNT